MIYSKNLVILVINWIFLHLIKLIKKMEMSMNVFIGTSLKDQCSTAGRSKFGSTPIKIMDIAFIKKRRDTPSDTFSKELNYIHKGVGRGSQGVPSFGAMKTRA